jgi:hypothetical protein
MHATCPALQLLCTPTHPRATMLDAEEIAQVQNDEAISSLHLEGACKRQLLGWTCVHGASQSSIPKHLEKIDRPP